MTNPLLDTSNLPRFAEIRPEHVVPAIRELIAGNRQKLEALLEGGNDYTFDALVLPLEEMEHELSRVWSPVSHLQGVLGSHDWRDAYNNALPLLTEYGTDLSQDARLQRAFAAVDRSLPASVDTATRTVVEHALRDFHLAGVDLPAADKARYKEIMQRLAATQAVFEQNIQDASDAWSLPVTSEAGLAGLPRQAIARAAAEARSRDRSGFLLTLDYPTYHNVMTHAEDRRLRETFYKAWSTRASDKGDNSAWDNSENIATILGLRHEAAQLVGFENYAEYSLATKMAGSTAEVLDFLRELASRSRTAAEYEISELKELAKTTLAPWDVAYWLEKFKQHKYSISDEQLRQYFPATVVVEGLFDLAEKLYGITLEEQIDAPVWHSDVVYYLVRDDSGDPIGGFYTDLYARSGKRSGAWIDECVGAQARQRRNDAAGRLPRLQFPAAG